MTKNYKAQGFYLVDVDAVALNNAGKSTSTNFDNGVATKTINKGGRSYTYVSGQALRSWWRNTLQRDYSWELSPVSREDKIAFTQADPLMYADDDIFGYMRAAKETVTDANGKTKKQDITVTRISPLKNSVLVSVASVRPAENWSSMARQEGDSVPYVKQEYSAIMKGMFSLDVDMIGTFSNYNKTGYKNLSDLLRKRAIEEYGCSEFDDPYVAGQKMVRMKNNVRIKRATDTIKALKSFSGGAMQTNNMADVTPKFIILATTNTGNHPFSHIATSEGVFEERVSLNVDAIREIIEDYKNTFEGVIYIGRRKGFMDDCDADLKKLQNDYPDLIVYGPVNSVIDSYCVQLSKQME